MNNENHRPHNTTIKKLADYFEITPAQLLGEVPLDEGGPATDAPGPQEIARRLELLEKKIASGEVRLPALTDDDRERLKVRYIRRGLVALRTEKLDAAALEALYFVLWKVERAEEGLYGGIQETGPREGESD